MDKNTTASLGALVILGASITAISYDDQPLAIALAAGLGAVAVVLGLLALLSK